MIDAARMGFEALIAKGEPGDGPADPWLCFQAGYLFGQVEEHRGTVHALAAIKGKLVVGAEDAADTGRGGGSADRPAHGHGKPGASTPGMPRASRDPLAASAPVAGARR